MGKRMLVYGVCSARTMDHRKVCSVSPPLHASLGEAATGSFLESRSPDVIQRTRFPPERSERMLKDKHRFDQINHKHTP